MKSYIVFEELCKKHNVNPMTVAKAANINPSTLSRWRNELIKSPSKATLIKIAEYFQTSIDVFSENAEVSESFKKLNLLLNKINMTIPSLAKEIQIPRQTLYRWRDVGSLPKYDTMLKICTYLQVDIDFFYDDEYSVEYASTLYKLSQLSKEKQNQVLDFIKTLT